MAVPIPKLTLKANDIHLWITRPQHIHDSELLARYRPLLSAQETQKQQRYRFEKHRHDALITRAFIRDLLSQYANLPPTYWAFEKGEMDKPEVSNAPLPIRFNISHTENLIICAVTLNQDIGCDVENITRQNGISAIARQYFSAGEKQELFSLPIEQQHSRFFDYWTLKESYIKAWGQGLAIPLEDFSFHINQALSAHINDDIQLSFAPQREDSPLSWRSWLFYPSDEHRIALSVRSERPNQATDYKLRFFESTPLIGYKEFEKLP